jgi:probable HAF family extracellular repeat protein
MKIRNAAKYAVTVVVAGALLAGCNSGASQSGFVPTGALQQAQSADQGTPNSGALKSAESETQSTPYSLVDLGTFGGPQSVVPQGLLLSATQVLNDRGTVVGWADTAAPDPFPAYCFDQFLSPSDLFSPGCNLANAFESQNGVLAQLGGLSQDSSAAAAISDKGLITGLSQNGQTDPLIPGFPELRAVVWAGQQAADLGTLGGNESYATGVNDRGQVIGSALNAVPDPYSFFGEFYVPGGASNTTQTRAFLWQNNTMTDIGTLGGPDAEAFGINRRGQIAGDAYTNDVPSPLGYPTDYPFLWTPGKGMKNLGTLGGDSINTVSGLNDKGEVIGSMYLKGDTKNHPYLWDGRQLLDLRTFGGPDGDAESINDAGEVVGWGKTTKPCPQNEGLMSAAFLWKNDHKTKIGTVPGTVRSDANSINSKSQVVGSQRNCDASFVTGYLWQHGATADLNTLIPPSSALHVYAPIEINDRGVVAGLGTLPNGDVHALLLVPNAHRHMSAGARTTVVPRKVTPAEVAVFRTFVAHMHDRFRRHRRL